MLVLVTLLSLGAGWMVYRKNGFLARADFHLEQMQKFTPPPNLDENTISCNPKMIERLFHHYDLIKKYKRAARYPWLPVEPDPPEPTP